MEKEKDNKTMNALTKLTKIIEDFNNKIENVPEIDAYYLDLVEDISKNEKMTKKQRKELALKTLKEKMPKVYTLLFEIDLISEAINSKIDELREDLDDKINELDDLESDKEDFEERLDNLR